MLCRVTAVSRFAALVVVLVCIGQATASLHLQVHHSGRQGNTSAANTTTGCLTYSTETACVSNAACAWNPSTGVCTNSSSGNSTNGNSTNCVNGTSLNSTNCNSTNGNGTMKGGRSSVRGVNRHCQAARTAKHCEAKAACYWDAIGVSCREAVVGAHAVSSDRTTSHLGSTSARSAGGAHGRDIAAPVVGGVLAVASVVGVALVRLRRGKKSLSTGGASDAAERVPIVRVCDDNTANE